MQITEYLEMILLENELYEMKFQYLSQLFF